MSLFRSVRSIYRTITAPSSPAPHPIGHTCHYLGDGEILVRMPTHTMIVPGWDLSLTPSILLNGAWEPAITSLVRRACSPGTVFLDVGAHAGWYTSVAAAAGATVHCFEPNPRLQTFLRKNIFLNAGGRTPLCSVNPCLVGDAAATIDMRYPHWVAGGAGVHNSNQHHFLDSLLPETYPTPVTTIDDFLNERTIDAIGIMKVDVEGHEEAVIRGATEAIKRSPGALVLVEYTRGRSSDHFPGTLFSLFDAIHKLPTLARMTEKMLHRYHSGDLWPDEHLIDLACVKGKTIA